MSNIGIIGYGIVGKAVDYGFRETNPKKDNKVLIYDKYKPEVSTSLEKAIKNSEFNFVCLPTPMNDYGIDLKIMNDNMKVITRAIKGTDNIVIIKSSVVPGTTQRYAEIYKNVKFAFNPEFLTEANYLEDFINPDRIIIGSNNDRTRLRVTDLYRDRFPTQTIMQTDTTTAEMVKYMANCYLATKVIFANEMCELCDKMKIKYEDVKKMVAGKTGDRRILDSHLDITTEKGFGGKCFPKDIVALIGLYHQQGLNPSLLKAVWEKNLKIRKNRDWEEIPFVTNNDKKD